MANEADRIAAIEKALAELQGSVRSTMDEVRHAARLQQSALTRKLDGDLEALRREIGEMSSRLVSRPELEQVRRELASGGGVSTDGPGWREAAELIPRLMTDLTRLRGEVDASTVRRSDLEVLAARIDALGPVEQRLAALEARPAQDARVQALQDRLAAMEEGRKALEDRLAAFEKRPSAADPAKALKALEDRLAALEKQPSAADPAKALKALEDRLAALEKRPAADPTKPLKALEDRIAALEKRPAVDPTKPLKALEDRLAALEKRPAVDPTKPLKSLEDRLAAVERRPAVDPAKALKALEDRLAALEKRPAAKPSAGGAAVGEERLEALASELAEHRERVRSLFEDLLGEQEPRLRHLEERLELALHDLMARAEELQALRKGMGPGTPTARRANGSGRGTAPPEPPRAFPPPPVTEPEE